MALVVGDTVGHAAMALAVADAYRERGADVDVLFLAADRGSAAEIEQAGYRLETIPASAIMRVGVVAKAAAIARVVGGLPRARALLAAHGTRLVIGSGGFASGGVLLAARWLGARTAIIEPNAVAGLSNRLSRQITDRVYLTVASAGSTFAPERCVLTGTPVQPHLAARLVHRAPQFPDGRPARVLVTTGSRGEQFLARHVPPLLAGLKRRGFATEVMHQCGALDPSVLAREYADIGVAAQVVPFIADMGHAYGWADLVIARAGASTLAEVALAGLPSLLVPLADAAADHQSANARAFAAGGAALWVRERDWRADRLVADLAVLLASPSGWAAMSNGARAHAAPEAARRIVDDCETLMRDRW